MALAPATLLLVESRVPEHLKSRLLHVSKYAEPGDEPVRLYNDQRPDYLAVPREWGLRHFSHIPIEDHTTLGESFIAPRRPNPHHPRVRDPVAQAKFMSDLYAQFGHRRSFIAQAGTGTG